MWIYRELGIGFLLIAIACFIGYYIIKIIGEWIQTVGG